MVQALVTPARPLKGRVAVPGDKSIAHRALLCGALANGWTRICGIPPSADVAATLRAINACGVQSQRNGDVVIVHGLGPQAWRQDAGVIDCANSGTTMRLLMGALCGIGVAATLAGDESLSRRPMLRVAQPLRAMGARITVSSDGSAPVRIEPSNTLSGVEIELSTPSAQIKSALLFAGLFASGRTTLFGRVDSRDHSERMLPQFGARIECGPGRIMLEGGAPLHGAFIEVPGDASSAAFWIAAALVTPGSELLVERVSLNQTRTGFIRVLKRMGALIETRVARTQPEPIGCVRVTAGRMHATDVLPQDIPQMIDELPVLAVLATQAHGTTTVRGASELRVKESDRIANVAQMLRAFGAEVETFDDGFRIAGPQRLRAARIDPHGDHRVAMSAAVAAMCAADQTTISQAECVAISYPSFFSTLAELAG